MFLAFHGKFLPGMLAEVDPKRTFESPAKRRQYSDEAQSCPRLFDEAARCA
jgi:hypothetical protein